MILTAITFQSTPSVWRETREVFNLIRITRISIHSLRVEGDVCRVNFKFVGFDISIHSLRVEGDRQGCNRCSQVPISIHSLRVEGDTIKGKASWYLGISIHSLRVEGDSLILSSKLLTAKFQSTPSVWRETRLDSNPAPI